MFLRIARYPGVDEFICGPVHIHRDKGGGFNARISEERGKMTG